MIEHDALDVGLVFPPKRKRQPGCSTCADFRRRLSTATDADRPVIRAELAAHAAERH